MPDKEPIHEQKLKIAIFASGTGSNTLKIIQYLKDHSTLSIALILTNNKKAGVLGIAEDNNISSTVLSREKFENGCKSILEDHAIDFIVLAGFLWKIPKNLIVAYPKRIINIHPALLPKYGGKGMYGNYVHEKVIENQELQSGITIHIVDEIYDNGEILFQATCLCPKLATVGELATEIHQLEHAHFPPVIEAYISLLTDGHKKTRT